MIRKEIKATVLFTTAWKRIKYLRINLPEKSKDLYSKNFKMLMKEIEDRTNIWEDIPCSYTGRIKLWKWTYCLRQSTDSVQSLWYNQRHFTQNYNKKFLIHMETQKIPSRQNNLEKEKQSWRKSLCPQIILQSYIIKTVWYWYKNRHTDLWNRIETPPKKRKPRNKPMHLWSINLGQWKQEYKTEKRQSLQ